MRVFSIDTRVYANTPHPEWNGQGTVVHFSSDRQYPVVVKMDDGRELTFLVDELEYLQ